MTTRPFALSRLAATEYHHLGRPDCTTPMEFGDFVHDPRFPDRHDANKILDFRCAPPDIEVVLDQVAEQFRAAGLGYMNLCGHSNAAYEAMLNILRPDDQLNCEWMLVHKREPTIACNPDVSIEVVEPSSPREIELQSTCPALARHEYYRTCDAHLDGSLVYAHLDGQIAGSTGYYTVGGMARFRGLNTIEPLRRRGVATTMIRFVQDHPQVRDQDGLVIFCDAEETIHLYERLGFVRHGYMWGFFRRF